MDFSTMNIWCWLIPLLVGILCAYFGYLLGKGKSTTIDNSADLKLLKDQNTKLQTDLDACIGKLSAGAAKASASSAATVVSSLTASETVVPFNAAPAKAALGKTVKQDDLKIVEGIGPKISDMFSDAGIKTWKALSDTTVADCQKVLDGGGNRYKVHDPASWPMQAKMLYEGKWAELAKWQDEHKHGKL
jgi:predicted flap endonuclease-1-like 5' DNA nuclease